MNWLFVLIVFSELVSVYFFVKIWKNQDYLLIKILMSALVLIPIVGPFLYLFVSDDTQPQSPLLKNNKPMSYYTHGWISVRPLLQKILKERVKDVEEGTRTREGQDKQRSGDQSQ